jgi:cobalamin biosynthesis Mg chelatase CobN
MKDPIIAEIRQVREAHAKRFSYDVYAILRDLKERQIKSGRKTVSLPPKRIKPIEQVTDTAVARTT